MEERRLTALAVAIAGPAAIGAVIGLPWGLLRVGNQAAATAAVALGVMAMMLPALYIVGTLTGIAPQAGQFGRAVLAAMRSSGMVMLGLSAPLAFLVVTSARQNAAFALGGAALAIGMLVGLRSLHDGLIESTTRSLTRGVRRGAVFGAWAFVSLVIGARMFANTLWL